MKRSLFLLFSLLVVGLILAGVGPARSRRTLVLAHNLDTKHPVHQGLELFAQEVATRSKGEIAITLYPNGQLGSEREVLEQLQIGAVSLTKVSSLSLESFSPLYGVINAPYVFRDEAHAYRALDGEAGRMLAEAALDKRIRGLTFYAAGARSFYANRPILKPEDLSGLKMRVMGSQTAITMCQMLGGSPVPMPFGEIYTGLQQGVIDGAENSITALTMSRHGEVAKHLSLDEHIIAPDVLLVSTQVWNGMTPEHRDVLLEAAEVSKIAQRKLWASAVKEHTRVARDTMGVEMHHPEKEPFRALVAPMHEQIRARGPAFSRLLDAVEKAG